MNNNLITINQFDKFPQIDNHVYVYLRISSDKQDITSQLNEVYNYCVKERLYPPSKNISIDEAVSGKISWKERKISNIIEESKKGTMIIVPEISRLGRNMIEINQLIGLCAEKKIVIIDVKNNLKLDGSFQTSMMATLYTMFSQMERQLISERTKQGMLIAKQKGHLKGGKKGAIKKHRLNGHEDEIKKMISEEISYRQI